MHGFGDFNSVYVISNSFNLNVADCRTNNIMIVNNTIRNISEEEVFKSGGRAVIRNPRPISILCNFSKVPDNIIYKMALTTILRV